MSNWKRSGLAIIACLVNFLSRRSAVVNLVETSNESNHLQLHDSTSACTDSAYNGIGRTFRASHSRANVMAGNAVKGLSGLAFLKWTARHKTGGKEVRQQRPRTDCLHNNSCSMRISVSPPVAWIDRRNSSCKGKKEFGASHGVAQKPPNIEV